MERALRTTLAQPFDRTSVGLSAFVAANKIVERVLSGEIPIRHGQDAAAIYTALINTARLEAGEATNHTLSVAMTDGHADLIDRIREAQTRASGEAIETSGEEDP